jgi:hypothetical protein
MQQSVGVAAERGVAHVNGPCGLHGGILIDCLRISGHRGRHFRLIADGISA